MFCGFEGFEVPRDLARLIEHGRVGGVALFARNLRDPSQVRELIRSLRSLAPNDAPLCVGLDQEGGRVQRLREPWTRWPAMRRIGERDDLSCTRDVAHAMAIELRDVGVGLDFAPCVDVDGAADEAIIGDRSFAADPHVVARHAAAFIGAMQAQGVACCAKHFPGHGGTIVDSHHELPRIAAGRDELARTALPPFAAAAQANVAAIMTAHILYERVDAKRPSTISPPVLEILRHELGFDGLVLTDDIEMKAVADRFAPGELAAGAVAAGADVVLACRRDDVRGEALRALERSSDAVLEPALRRLVAFKTRFLRAPDPVDTTDGPPYPSHEALARMCLQAKPRAGGREVTVDPTESWRGDS